MRVEVGEDFQDRRKARFVRLVDLATERRLAEVDRRHNACVAPGLGPKLLARRFRPDALPGDDALEAFAERLVDWALGFSPAEPRPYSPRDLEPG